MQTRNPTEPTPIQDRPSAPFLRSSARGFLLLFVCTVWLFAVETRAGIKGGQIQAEDRARVAADMRLLGEENQEAFGAAWRRLVGAGEIAVEEALRDWGQVGPAARVARARLLVKLAPEIARGPDAKLNPSTVRGAARLEPYLSLERSPEADTRAALAAALGTHALAREGIPMLTDLIVNDPAKSVRQAALQAILDSAEPSGAEALDAILVRLPVAQRSAAAKALAKIPAARVRVVRRVQQALLSGSEALAEVSTSGGMAHGLGDANALRAALGEPGTLAALAAGYGRALAELPQGGSTTLDRAPFLLLRSHPDPRVRAAGRASLDRMLGRLVELGEEQRAQDFLAAIARDGLSPREVLYRRARLALAGLGDAASARKLAQELLRTADSGMDSDSQVERDWMHYALVLEGASEFALGNIDSARANFDRAKEVLKGLIGDRQDLRPSIFNAGDYPIAPVGGAVVVDHIIDLGLLQVWSSLCALADGQPVTSTEVLEPLRQAHLLVLGAQLFGQRSDSVFDVRSLDDFLDRDLSPRRLLLVSRELPGGAEGRFLNLQLLLGQALSTVVPQEVMGFERVEVEQPEHWDVFLDDERFGLLKAIAFAQRESAQRAWYARRAELSARVLREDNPIYQSSDQRLQDPEYLQVLGLFQQEREASQLRQGASPQARKDPTQRSRLYPELKDLRTPSLFALTLSGELRQDGRSKEARLLAQRMLADLRSSSGPSALWTEWISARVEMAIGSAWMDENRPEEAEDSGLAAVRRLEALERSLEEMIGASSGDPGRALGIRRQKRQTELLRAEALLSLAVNANVRAKDPEKALDYFEKAFQLDDREYMRVLLACYRARSGRSEEARSVLRGVKPTPALFYNLACTFALLGDHEQALDYLQRELDENHPTPGALERQKDWARADPDLEALKGDPRFERMTAPD